MAKCWKCFKRCRADLSCLWCGRGPMCLNCKCDCRLWPGGVDQQHLSVTPTKKTLADVWTEEGGERWDAPEREH